jgi:uncharacterized protein (DUF952 family)
LKNFHIAIMSTLDAQPHYLYKIIASSAPIREPIPERLPVSELDQNSGFIHLSMAHQVPNTLKMFFKDEPVVYVLRIEYGRVVQDIRWESPDAKVCGPRPGEGLFPVSSIATLSKDRKGILYLYIEAFV